MDENQNHPDPWDILSASEPYWTAGYAAVAEFVKFEYGFNALVWLYRKVANNVTEELQRLEALLQSDRYRNPYFTDDSDEIVSESAGTLRHAGEISSGAIIAACSSAVESLFMDLLPESSSGPRAPRGLVAKAQFLMTTWPDVDKAAEFIKHVRWLSQRRNSFAHRLIHEGGGWDPTGTAYNFDEEAVKETFERVGKIVTILEQGYDAYRSRVGF